MKRLQEMNPLTAAVYYFCVLGLTMFTDDPLILCLSLIFSLANCVADRAAGLRSHVFSVVVFLAATLINPIVSHNGVTALFYINDRPFTLEALLRGAAAAVMIVASLYWLRCLSKSMTSDKVMYLLTRFSPKLALLLPIILRFVGLFRLRWRKIRDAQRALGLFEDGNLIDAVRGRARVLSILITWTLENGIITAESMESRGYGSGRRTSLSVYRVHLSDSVFILVCLALTALCAAGLLSSRVVYYPEISMDLLNTWGLCGGAAFAVLGSLPLILRAKEALVWRSLRSTI